MTNGPQNGPGSRLGPAGYSICTEGRDWPFAGSSETSRTTEPARGIYGAGST